MYYVFVFAKRNGYIYYTMQIRYKKETLSKSMLCEYFVRKVANKSSQSIRHKTPIGRVIYQPPSILATLKVCTYLYKDLRGGVMDKSGKTKSINSSNRLLDRIVHTSNHHCCLWSNCLLKSLCWYNILVEEGPFYTYIKEPYRLVQLSKRN